MTRQTSFEQLLSAFLEDGHEVTFRKDSIGNIIFMIDVKHGAGRKRTLFWATSLKEIGEEGIKCLVSDAYKMDSDQGGAGKTRIDGGDQVCNNAWHDPKNDKMIVGVTYEDCPLCSESWVWK